MLLKCLFAALCAAQCVTTGIYVNAYRIPGSRKVYKKMICSTIFVIAGILGTIYTGGFGLYSIFILSGLVLSWLGDYFLVKGLQGLMFVLGLTSFLLGHVSYIFAFSNVADEVLRGSRFLSGYELIMIASLMILVFIVKFACKIHFDGMGIPVFIYAVAICTMLTKAAFIGIRAVQAGYARGLTILLTLLIGAVCFVASDAVLVFILFKKKKGIKYEAANLITYYAAQMLLAGSIFLIG